MNLSTPLFQASKLLTITTPLDREFHSFIYVLYIMDTWVQFSWISMHQIHVTSSFVMKGINYELPLCLNRCPSKRHMWWWESTHPFTFLLRKEVIESQCLHLYSQSHNCHQRSTDFNSSPWEGGGIVLKDSINIPWEMVLRLSSMDCHK